jgi:hypothetical protein
VARSAWSGSARGVGSPDASEGLVSLSGVMARIALLVSTGSGRGCTDRRGDASGAVPRRRRM